MLYACLMVRRRSFWNVVPGIRHAIFGVGNDSRGGATVPPLPPETSPPRSRGQELLKIKGFGPKSTFGSDDTGRLVFSSPTGTISRCGKRSHQERWINSPPSSPEAFNSPLASYGSSVARSLWMRCPSTPKAPRQRYDVFGLPALRAS